MGSLWIGILGFICLYAFDFHKLHFLHKSLNSLFLIGCLMLFTSTMITYLNSPSWISVSAYGTMFFQLLAVLSLIFMFYCLFFALPFNDTYVDGQNTALVDNGVYRFCRHPGVYGFVLTYLFLFLSKMQPDILVLGTVLSLIDVHHVYIQDRHLFPKLIEGYADYQKRVPFLIGRFKKDQL